MPDLEQTVEKSLKRNEIISQVEAWMILHRPKAITAVTLPAEQWFFEHRMNASIKDVPIEWFCAEHDKNRCLSSIKKMPSNGNILNGTLDQVFGGKVVWKNGIGYLEYADTYQPNDPIESNFYWADYCAYATVALLEAFAKDISEGRVANGLAYATFNVKGLRGGRDAKKTGAERGTKDYLKRFNKYSNASTIQEAVTETLNYFIAKHCKGIKVYPIYNVVYGGGAREGTTMLTVGYSVGFSQAFSKLIYIGGDTMIEKREWRASRHNVVAKLKDKGFVLKAIGAKGKRTKTIKVDPEDLSLTRKILKRHIKGAGNIDISNELGVSVRQVGSTLAWLKMIDRMKDGPKKTLFVSQMAIKKVLERT